MKCLISCGDRLCLQHTFEMQINLFFETAPAILHGGQTLSVDDTLYRKKAHAGRSFFSLAREEATQLSHWLLWLPNFPSTCTSRVFGDRKAILLEVLHFLEEVLCHAHMPSPSWIGSVSD
jgi:hypothetical protein